MQNQQAEIQQTKDNSSHRAVTRRTTAREKRLYSRVLLTVLQGPGVLLSNPRRGSAPNTAVCSAKTNRSGVGSKDHETRAFAFDRR